MSWIDDAKREAARHTIASCPKCGGKAEPCGDRTCGFETYWVRCSKCGYENDWNVSVSAAITDWNRLSGDAE